MQVAGTPQQPNGHDCGVYTAMMADAVCQVISEMRQEEEGLLERDVHGVEAIRRVLKRVCRVKVQHAVLYRIILTRALLQEWDRGGRGGDELGDLSPEDGAKMLADATWDRHLQSRPFQELAPEELRCEPQQSPFLSTLSVWPPVGPAVVVSSAVRHSLVTITDPATPCLAIHQPPPRPLSPCTAVVLDPVQRDAVGMQGVVPSCQFR